MTHLDRGVATEELFDRRRYPLVAASQETGLVRMLERGQRPHLDEILGRTVSGSQEDVATPDEILVLEASAVFVLRLDPIDQFIDDFQNVRLLASDRPLREGA